MALRTMMIQQPSASGIWSPGQVRSQQQHSHIARLISQLMLHRTERSGNKKMILCVKLLQPQPRIVLHVQTLEHLLQPMEEGPIS